MHRLEEHLQTLAEEVPHRVAEEILQQGQTQGFIAAVRRQVIPGLGLLLGRQVQRSPFTGITEQAAALVEVAGTEGLQRVLHGQGMQQLFASIELIALLGSSQAPTAGEVIAQLPDQYRGRTFAVVTNAAADPADIQLVARRQQCFKQQVTVILAA
ncbi:hypothetical protein D3C79_861720 [compost metagenome]